MFSRIASTAAQAANSRIFEVRNTHATNLLIPTRLVLRAIQTAAGTAQENSLDVFKCTAFSALDTVSTATPVASTKRTTMSAHAGNGADIRTLVAAAAGMTGGNMTKDAIAFASLAYNVATAINTTTVFQIDCFDDNFGTYPFTFVQNEGFEIENRVLNVTSYGITWYIDFSFAIVAAY